MKGDLPKTRNKSSPAFKFSKSHQDVIMLHSVKSHIVVVINIEDYKGDINDDITYKLLEQNSTPIFIFLNMYCSKDEIFF